MSGAWHDQPWPRALFTAVQFLTRLPVPGGLTRDLSTYPEDIKRGLIFFPVIGAVVGALTASALLALSFVMPFAVAVVLALAVEALLTGAFHEDAVADFFDAFGGGWTREDVLRILKDSRIGSFGALGLGLAVGLRAMGLIAIGTVPAAMFALIVSGAVGRLVILAVMALVPPVPARDGLAKGVGQSADWGTLTAGLMIVAPLLAWASWRDSIGMAVTAALLLVFVLAFRRYLMRRLGGVTGDCLGFSAYAGILVTTLVLARKV